MAIFAEGIRNGPEQLDERFRQIRSALREAYRDWKDDISHEWIGYDKLGTPEASKQQFDRLMGLLHQKRLEAFHTINMSRELRDQVSEDKYRYEYDDVGELRRDHVQVAKDNLRRVANAVDRTRLNAEFTRLFGDSMEDD